MRAALVVALAWPALAAAQTRVTWHVDDDGPGDPGPGDVQTSDPFEDGTALHPFDAIQEAVDAAAPGDEVLVHLGVYRGVGNRDVRAHGKAITIRGAGTASETRILCEWKGRGFLFDDPLDTCVVEDLMIVNGLARFGGGVRVANGAAPTLRRLAVLECGAIANGGGIHSSDSAPQILACRVQGNVAQGSHGGGLFLSGGAPLVSSTLIAENEAGFSGGGLYCVDGTSRIELSTLARNESTMIGGALAVDHATLDMASSILWGSHAGLLGRELFAYQSTFALSHSYVDGGLGSVSWVFGAVGPGVGNSSLDPSFANPLIGNYHLSPLSPCINAGDPSYVPAPGETDMDGQPRLFDTAVDVGADERQ